MEPLKFNSWQKSYFPGVGHLTAPYKEVPAAPIPSKSCFSACMTRRGEEGAERGRWPQHASAVRTSLGRVHPGRVFDLLTMSVLSWSNLGAETFLANHQGRWYTWYRFSASGVIRLCKEQHAPQFSLAHLSVISPKPAIQSAGLSSCLQKA